MKEGSEKKKLLQSRYDIDVTSDMEEEMRTMCNLSEGIAEEAWKEGMEQGLEKKTLRFVINLLKKKFSYEEISELAETTRENVIRIAEENGLAYR